MQNERKICLRLLMLLNHCLVLTQHDKQLLTTREKFFRVYIVVDIHPLKHAILRHCSVVYSEIENNVLQSPNDSSSLLDQATTYFDFSSLSLAPSGSNSSESD